MTQKVAIVTGGTNGIGLATTKKFLKEGYAVMIADLHENQERLAELQKLGTMAFFQCDISQADRVQALVDETVKRFGRIDVAANVAGILGKHMPFVKADLDNIRQVINVNLMGTINVDQKVAAQMVKQGSRVIVNVGSLDGFIPNFESVGYIASKGGVRLATAAIAREVAPHGVRVLPVAPGWVETGMVEPAMKSYGAPPAHEGPDHPASRDRGGHPPGNLARSQRHQWNDNHGRRWLHCLQGYRPSQYPLINRIRA